MGDILTQMQDELDLVPCPAPLGRVFPANPRQLLHRMATSLRWIRDNAPPSVPPGQQRLDTFAELEARNAAESTQTTIQTATAPSALTQAPAAAPNPQAPMSKLEFDRDISEFAADIVTKEQQIEHLIAHLPGLDFSEQEQVERMKDLERQLEQLEDQRLGAVKQRETMLQLVESKIQGVGRVP